MGPVWAKFQISNLRNAGTDLSLPDKRSNNGQRCFSYVVQNCGIASQPIQCSRPCCFISRKLFRERDFLFSYFAYISKFSCTELLIILLSSSI